MRRRLRRRLPGALLASLLALAAQAPSAGAATDPLFVFTPEPPPPPAAPQPNGYLNGPCGLAVDSGGRFYVADYYHGAVDVFTGARGYLTQLAGLDGPCGLAVDSAGSLYVNSYHGGVKRYTPSAFPPAVGTPYGPGTTISAGPATGVAVDPSSGDVYVDERTHVAVYDSAGNPVEVGGQPLRIGAGSLEDGYGVAVSGYPGTEGRVYLADAASQNVKVYDPALDPDNPIATIGGPGLFTSLRDSALAVDDETGAVYVLDDTQPEAAEQPRGRVQVFTAAGSYRGHLKYDVVDGGPSGLAVDNSGAPTRGRVYVTSGNTTEAAVYAYPTGVEPTTAAPSAPTAPPPPAGGELLQPRIRIGAAAAGGPEIACEGDACQVLPPEPLDPTLTTLLEGLGNPKVRYRRYGRGHRTRHRRHRHHHRRRGAKRKQGHSGRAAARASAVAVPGATSAAPAIGGDAGGGGGAPAPRAAALPAAAAGFEAEVRADGGEAATLAGSHPYGASFSVGLEGEDLRNLRIDLPPGLLLDPAATSLCGAGAFATPRSSAFEASLSGESCPGRSQLGTVQVTTGGGETRRFGLFDLDPAAGAALQLGASPYGTPMVFDVLVEPGPAGAHYVLQAEEVPQALQLHGLQLGLWGAPWDASHNGERGDCLNEAEPGFPWCKSSVGEPATNGPLAFLTLPTACGEALSFGARADSWQRPGALAATAVNRDSGGAPAPLGGCDSLGFDTRAEGLLTVRKASSSSGFAFRFDAGTDGLADPRARVESLTSRAVVELPAGVTLNPSLGAGLGVCTPAQLAAESATAPPGAGCPNASKIGDFDLKLPFYEGTLEGGIYLAAPHENPYDSLLAVYLLAKSAARGMLVTASGKLVPDPADGTLTATFEGLPQIPYTDLEVNFRSGQRAPLVSPPACGAARTRIALAPWSGGAERSFATDSQIAAGIDNGPCPDGSTPPFAPGAVAGGVNANVGSYTPYFVHLSRRDYEQEITSYSLVLPKGITGRLSGIPFCPDAAIAAARERSGFAETAGPSCPVASQVGRTETGYGVGPALTSSPGRVYLAGPYHGAPLSLVTINAATVGPFDLGTVVVRSAFDVDPVTAQLRIDSSASDPIPHILQGVPLHVRDIRVYLDRPQFTRNPTSCEASQLVSTLTGSGASFGDPADDSSATVTKHFQLLNCLTLGFRPKLGLRLLGGVRRSAHPALRAMLRARPGDASLKQIAVTMPHALFLAQDHIRQICTRVQFDADSCPADSAYGRAVVYSSLFTDPLRGPVYLRSSTHRFPDLVASLHSGAVRIVLEGRIGPSKKGGIRVSFDSVPDAPIEAFVMQLDGGRRGLLVNSVNVCAKPPAATVKALGQNNRGVVYSTTLRARCGKGRKHRKGSGQAKRRSG